MSKKKKKKQKTQLEGWKRTVALLVVILFFLAGGTFVVVDAIKYLGVERQAAVEKSLTYESFWDGWNRKYAKEDYSLYFQEETLWISGSCTGWALEEKLLALPENTPVTVLVHPEGHYIMQLQTEAEVLLDFDTAARKMATESYLSIGLGAICYGAAVVLVVLERKKKL